MDWWLSSIDPSRAHMVDFAISWHARMMVIAWGVLAPLTVFSARYFKVLPWQDWPRELDSQAWWKAHWMGNGFVVLCTVFGLGLILGSADGGSLHGQLGYAMLVLLFVQVTLGVFRGTKGGPTALSPDGSPRGDHYDMTPWRIMFEWVHKLTGYALLALGIWVILLGLWLANAPRWMWLLLGLFWAGLALGALALQRRGWAIDTYQAIWGPSEKHPGNQRKPIGLGIRRPVEREPGE